MYHWNMRRLVLRVVRIPYRLTRTYDLLPAGETGTYRVHGIALRSTFEHDDD